MGKKTNHLGSHHPETKSYSADKSVPKEVMKRMRKGSAGHSSKHTKFIKKLHTKRTRRYHKNRVRKDIEGEE